MSPEDLCVFSFLSIAWVLSVYGAYHLGRNLENRSHERIMRRNLESLCQ